MASIGVTSIASRKVNMEAKSLDVMSTPCTTVVMYQVELDAMIHEHKMIIRKLMAATCKTMLD
jgi:hypothetical protein